MAALSKNGDEIARFQKVTTKDGVGGPETTTTTISIRSNRKVMRKIKVERTKRYEWERPTEIAWKVAGKIKDGKTFEDAIANFERNGYTRVRA